MPSRFRARSASTAPDTPATSQSATATEQSLPSAETVAAAQPSPVAAPASASETTATRQGDTEAQAQAQAQAAQYEARLQPSAPVQDEPHQAPPPARPPVSSPGEAPMTAPSQPQLSPAATTDTVRPGSSTAGVDDQPAPVPPTDRGLDVDEIGVGIDSHIVPPQENHVPREAERPARAGWLARLRGGLARTRSQISVIFSRSKIDESLYEELETALLASDAGYSTSEWLLTELRARAKRDRINDAATLKAALTQILTELLTPLEQPIQVDRAEPLVMMIAGVNGAGKTTSIGKLARHLHQIDQSVLLAAGDTFRAAAREQLARWGERNQVQVIASEGGDPAAVAFDSVKAGQARKVDVVMIDTAGRLPTQRHLMDELKKIRRVIGKAMPDAPHEVLLVLDGNTGQNMLAQVKAFDDAVQLTGLIVTKLDGTAKGGAIAALAHTRRDKPLPVYFIGVGEGVEDLQAFSAQEFASALLH
ncbi:MAG: signal recognition particle-docking protein FtsY [Lautropia sp.]|nr:signal recognition particle-docking protein FtsY [Lautropia sp.]